MPLIGDELRTILGMMPTRDRAGIARGTMADDAMRSSAAAESGNAEGAALMQQGGAPRPAPMPGPPQIKLPPMGGPGGDADIQIPDDMQMSYASGKSGPSRTKSGVVSTPGPTTIPTPAPIVPAPQERVVAAGPAAAPPAKVATSASDVAIALLEQRERQQKMMQLVGSLGLIANAFNRNPESQSATRSSLAGMMGGGGHGGDGGISISDIKTIAGMKADEAKAVSDAAAKENAIKQSMTTEGWSRDYAEMMFNTGNLTKRFDPTEQRARQGLVDTEKRRKMALDLVPMLAKARGTEEAVLRGMAEKDPDAVIAMGEREKLVDLSKKETDERGNQRKDLLDEADALAWARHVKDPQSLKDAYPDIEPARIDEALKSPTVYKKLMEELTTKGGAGPMDPITKEVVEKQLLPAKEKARLLAQSNATEIKEQQDLWRKDLKVGSPHTSEFMFNLSKSWSKLTGQPLPEGTQVTEKMMQQQVAGTLATLKQLGAGTGLSNADREYASKAQGGFATTADTLKYLLYLKEKENNFRIDEHNKEVAKASGYSREIRNREGMFKVEHAAPNRFMREQVEERMPGFIADVVRKGTWNDPAMKEKFEKDPDIGVGPGVYDHLVKEELARQKTAKKD